jgi:hypothetical protein
VREAKKSKDQQYLVVRAIEKHWRNKDSDIAVALKTLGGVGLEGFGAVVKPLCQAPDLEGNGSQKHLSHEGPHFDSRDGAGGRPHASTTRCQHHPVSAPLGVSTTR